MEKWEYLIAYMALGWACAILNIWLDVLGKDYEKQTDAKKTAKFLFAAALWPLWVVLFFIALSIHAAEAVFNKK